MVSLLYGDSIGRCCLFLGIALAHEGGENVHAHHLYGALVVAAVRDDDVGILLCRFDELIVHRFEDVAIFRDQHFQRMSAFGDVALNDAQKAFVGLSVNKNLEVHEVAQVFVVERHDAFNDDDVAGFHVYRFFQTRAGDVRVGGLLNGASGTQLGNLVGKQRPFKSVGMVEIGYYNRSLAG